MVTFLQKFDLFLNVLVQEDQPLHEILIVGDTGNRIQLKAIQMSIW